ncbi:acyltransferase [Puteibacter caeruleilacunae]|nr:acyltransferase [Puteibacter caeruleilacunae]
MTFERRYDIDWLRVIAIWLLIIYHLVLCFQPWASAFLGFIQNDKSVDQMMIPMSMLNIWRIPLLFYISGMGVCFTMRKRNWKQLLLERSRRILIPLLFGTITIIPLGISIWQNYYRQKPDYVAHPGHLWFLGNIFLYVLILFPLFYWLKKKQEGKLVTKIKKVFSTPWILLLILFPFVIETYLMKPQLFALFAYTLHGFFFGFFAFLFGFLVVFSGSQFWKMIIKLRWGLLIIAAALFSIRYLYFDLNAPGMLIAVESNIWIFTMMSFGHKHLNKSNGALTYLNKASYPIYILHMFFLFIGSYLIFPLDIPVSAKFIAVLLITFTGCYGTYEIVIRRVKPLRPLFGLNYKDKAN